MANQGLKEEVGRRSRDAHAAGGESAERLMQMLARDAWYSQHCAFAFPLQGRLLTILETAHNLK